MCDFEYTTDIVMPLSSYHWQNQMKEQFLALCFPLDIASLFRGYLTLECLVRARVQSRSPYLIRQKFVVSAELFLDYPERKQPYLLMVSTDHNRVTSQDYRFYDCDYSSLELREQAMAQAQRQQGLLPGWETLVQVIQSERFEAILKEQCIPLSRKEKREAVTQWQRKYSFCSSYSYCSADGWRCRTERPLLLV